MRKILSHPAAIYIRTVMTVLVVLFVLGAIAAMLSKSLSTISFNHSQIESSHRDGLSLSTHTRMSLTGEPLCELREPTQVAMNAGTARLTFALAGIYRELLQTQHSYRGSDIALDMGRLNWRGLPGRCEYIRITQPLATVELGPVNPARLTAAYRTL